MVSDACHNYVSLPRPPHRFGAPTLDPPRAYVSQRALRGQLPMWPTTQSRSVGVVRFGIKCPQADSIQFRGLRRPDWIKPSGRLALSQEDRCDSPC